VTAISGLVVFILGKPIKRLDRTVDISVYRYESFKVSHLSLDSKCLIGSGGNRGRFFLCPSQKWFNCLFLFIMPEITLRSFRLHYSLTTIQDKKLPILQPALAFFFNLGEFLYLCDPFLSRVGTFFTISHHSLYTYKGQKLACFMHLFFRSGLYFAQRKIG